MQHKKQRIIPAREAAKLPRAVFKPFDRKPVNYYRDMIVEDDPGGAARLSEQDYGARVEKLLSDERQKWKSAQEQESRRQFEAGLAQGRQEGSTEFKRALDLLTEYTRVLQAEKQEIAGRAERHSIDLAFALAQKIIGQELEVKPELVRDIARMALEQVLDCNQVELKVSSEDYNYLKTVQNDLQTLLSSQAKLELRADSSLKRGSCLVETERGVLDARIGSQLDTLRSSLSQQTPRA